MVALTNNEIIDELEKLGITTEEELEAFLDAYSSYSFNHLQKDKSREESGE